jgi:hypothetical protein
MSKTKKGLVACLSVQDPVDVHALSLESSSNTFSKNDFASR